MLPGYMIFIAPRRYDDTGFEPAVNYAAIYWLSHTALRTQHFRPAVAELAYFRLNTAGTQVLYAGHTAFTGDIA